MVLLQRALTQPQQLDLFREYKRKLQAAIGKERTDDLVRNAGYIVSSGTNDFTFNYYGPVLVRRSTYPNIADYQKFQWNLIEQFMQVFHLSFSLLHDNFDINILGIDPGKYLHMETQNCYII